MKVEARYPKHYEEHFFEAVVILSEAAAAGYVDFGLRKATVLIDLFSHPWSEN